MYSNTQITEEFRKGGRVQIVAPNQPSDPQPIDAGYLIAMLKKYSEVHPDVPRCEHVLVQGFSMAGFDLKGSGTGAKPIVAFTLEDCTLIDGMDLSMATIQGMVLRNCFFPKIQAHSKANSDSNSNRNPAVFIAQEITVLRTLKLDAVSFSGRVDLRAGHIGGQLLFEGVRIDNGNRHEKERLPLAMMAEGLHVDSDFFFRQSSRACRIIGQIDLVGANVKGDLQIDGSYRGGTRMRAFKCLRIKIGGDLHCGYIPEKDRRCIVKGELDFTGASIAGEAIFSGSTHRLNMSSKGRSCNDFKRRKQGVSINLRGATVGNDVLFEGSCNAPCYVQGVSLIGATIGGRFLVRGTTMEAYCRDGEYRKAITANGANIRGGIQITEDEYNEDCKQLSKIVGDFRLRRANVGGPVVFRGVHLSASQLEADPGGEREERKGIALWAANTRFESDVVFEPCGKKMSEIQGELRFWGATIVGTLYVQGMNMTAKQTATALDCYAADIQKGIVLGDFDPTKTQRKGDRVGGKVKGLVSFNFSRAQSLTVGSDPSVRTDEGEHLLIEGALTMRDMKVQGATVISNVLFRPAESLGDGDTLQKRIVKRLNELGMYRRYTIIHANYACFGTRLFVRLREEHPKDQHTVHSSGLINLYGANAGTVGALSGNDQNTKYNPVTPSFEQLIDEERKKSNPLTPPHEPTKISENWGPKGKPRRQYRRGKHRHTEDAAEDILINLDEFTYQRLNDKTEREDSIQITSDDLISEFDTTIKEYAKWARTHLKWLQNTATCIDKYIDGKLPSIEIFLENSVKRLRMFWVVRAHIRLVCACIALTFRHPVKAFWYYCVEIIWSYAICGRPTPSKLDPRFGWLQRQIENPQSYEPVIISPYRQLAKSYREMGNLNLSYYYTRERRWLQIKFGKLNRFQRLTDRLFSGLFGFGYSPRRAVATLMLLFCLSCCFVLVAGNKYVVYSPKNSEQGATPQYETGELGPKNAACVDSSRNTADTGEKRITKPNRNTNADCTRAAIAAYPVLEALQKSDPPPCVVPLSLSTWFDTLNEAYRIIMPFMRFQTNGACVVVDSERELRLFHGSLQLLSWILFPLAAITFSGVLREKQD